MFTVSGKYGTAKIYAADYNPKAISQIIGLLNQPFVSGRQVRIMPDYHAGAGCVIGFTCGLGDKVIPNLVGVDIGCGMHVSALSGIPEDTEWFLKRIDEVIRKYIPSGFSSHNSKIVSFDPIKDLYCYKELKNKVNFELQIGTLGGGNHFIELNVDDYGNYYLVVHSGSRNLGKQVADHYQKMAIRERSDQTLDRVSLVERLKLEGRAEDIQEELAKMPKTKIPNDLCYLEGISRDMYLHDMAICQKYASVNREAMSHIIISALGLSPVRQFETIHNYVEDGLIRKGAVSAKRGEELIIPINMRDGSLLCYGKGNSDWNNSAPHGAGRLMSRSEAKKNLSMEDFTASMDGIYTTSVSEHTLDEAPDANKPMGDITSQIGDTVEIRKVIKPVYNFKAS